MKFSNVIYKISFVDTNEVYIGQTNNFPLRKQQHLETAFDETLPSFHYKIYKAIRKYGKENAIFSIIHSNIKTKQMNFMEVKEIERHNSIKCGFNMVPGGGFPNRGPDKPPTKKVKEVILEKQTKTKKKTKKQRKKEKQERKHQIATFVPMTVQDIVLENDNINDVKSPRKCERCLKDKELRFFNKIKGGIYNTICMSCTGNQESTGSRSEKLQRKLDRWKKSSFIVKNLSWENFS